MEDSQFWVFAGRAATVLALIGGIHGAYAFTRKEWDRIKQSRLDADAQFDAEMEKLKAAGNSVSARTDLSMVVMLELDRQKSETDALRQEFQTSLLFTVCALGVSMALVILISVSDEPRLKGELQLGAGFLVTLALVVSGVISRMVSKSNEATAKYRERVARIWQEPVEKRQS